MNSQTHQADLQLTAIELKRRSQLIEATTAVLAEHGYVGTSFAKIAKQAKTSRSLALYHFKNKDDLMYQTIQFLMEGWHTYITQQVQAASSAESKLAAYITSNFTYMIEHPPYFPAVIEIFFNARDPEGQLLYRIQEDDPNLAILERILQQGQDTGEFRDSFDARMVAVSIRASIDQVLGQMPVWPTFDVERYTSQIVDLYSSALKR